MFELDELLERRVAALVTIRDAPDRVVGLLKSLNRDADTDLGEFLTQVNDTIGKEAVSRDHDAVGLLVELTYNFLEIGTDERLTTRDIGEVHLRELFNGLEGDFLVGTAGSLVTVAHGASSVAAIRNDNRTVKFLFYHN